MLKTYDSALQAYTEHPPKNHDTALNAWVDSPSAKTYDTKLGAWVEHLRLYNFFRLLAYDFSSGQGGYIRKDDDQTVEFYFAQDSIGLMDHVSLVWEGDAVTGSVFMGEFYSTDDNLNPDVYFYYRGYQVHSSKLRTQENTLFGIPYSGSVDRIVINIVPYTACEFHLIKPWFGKTFKFDL